jgi:hypothetical protein
VTALQLRVREREKKKNEKPKSGRHLLDVKRHDEWRMEMT